MASFSFQSKVISGRLVARSTLSRMTTFIAALAFALAMQLVAQSSASAICDAPRTTWEVDNNSKIELAGHKTSWVGKGVTPKLVVGRTISATAEFSQNVGAEGSVIVATISGEIGVTLALSFSRTVQEEYEGDKTPAGKLSRIVVYAEARQARVRKMRLQAPCKYVPAGPLITVKAPKKNGTTIVRQQFKKDTKSSKAPGQVAGVDGSEGSIDDETGIEEVDLPYDPELGELNDADETNVIGDETDAIDDGADFGDDEADPIDDAAGTMHKGIPGPRIDLGSKTHRQRR